MYQVYDKEIEDYCTAKFKTKAEAVEARKDYIEFMGLTKKQAELITVEYRA
jgi:hypothetical protein